MLPAQISVPGARSRDHDGATLVRTRRDLWRVIEANPAELALRAALPTVFGPVRGVVPSDGHALLLDEPPRGVRGDRLPRSAVDLGELVLLAWRLHWAGHTPRELGLQDLMLGPSEPSLRRVPAPGSESQCAQALAFLAAQLAGRRPTAALRAPRLAEVVFRALDGGANLMLRAALSPLADMPAMRAWCANALVRSREGGLAVALVVPDAETGRAVAALLADAALQAGLCLLPEGAHTPGAMRLLHATGPESAAAQLARQRGPAICLLQAEHAEARAALAHLAEIPPWPTPGRTALAQWLRPLGAPPELVSELLLPHCERDPAGARRLVITLIERAGASMAEGQPALGTTWPDELRAMTASRRVDVIHPGAARLALLLALSRPGLDAGAVETSPELRRGAELLSATGLAARDGGVIVAGPGLPDPAVGAPGRRAACLWLAEREYFCPWPDELRRAAWCAALRLRSGDLGVWDDADGANLFLRLWQAQHFELALDLCEAHAACAARFGAGPPDVKVQIAARDLALSQWPPRRARRLLRLWLRGYHGPWRALLLGLRALLERQLSGPEAYMPLVGQVRELALAPGVPRLAREQAILAAAHACSFEQPDEAMALLKLLPDEPAQSAALCVRARMLYVRAECAFISIRTDEALALAQQAREQLAPRGWAPIRARWEAEIESLLAMTHGMAVFFSRPVDEVMAPLRELEARHGGCRDVVARTLVNQHLFRLRLREIGSLSPADSQAVLAEARPDNLRGYMIVLYQLSENAAYRGDAELVRRLGARLAALNAPQVSPMAWVGWARHEALRLALAGDFRAALRWWRRGGV
ncbi:MAG: hypothetical protein KJ044_01205, partial [Planctomycetes bacterium]|nr:hypothetical protein [Planctomycetota bacterium]